MSLETYQSELWRLVSLLDIDKIKKIIQTIKQKDRIFIIGNGGNAAAASHFATDMSKGAGYKAISLTDNVPLISAIGNDYGYENIFSQQLIQYNANFSDVLFALSVSGTSKNIVQALSQSYAYSILITGNNKEACQLANITIKIDSNHFGLVEDVTNIILHMIAYELK